MVHGIEDAELEQGPSFDEVCSRCFAFLESLLNSSVVDFDSSDEESPDFATRLGEDAELLLCGHNLLKFDAPFFLSECLRNNLPVASFERWFYVDTLAIFRAVPDMAGGCMKLQCLRHNAPGHGGLSAHRALDAAWEGKYYIAFLETRAPRICSTQVSAIVFSRIVMLCVM
jgi:hypothetical protein